jgi:predicted transcriptional regulator
MLSIASNLVGSLELAIMECFWGADGPLSSGDILATLRKTRTIADTTVTTTLARLYEQGLLTRTLDAGRKKPWIYTARYASRGALVAGVLNELCVQIGADPGDRAEALGVLLGAPR